MVHKINMVKLSRLLTSTIFLSLLTLPAIAQDGDYLAGPPPGNRPLEVLIGFNLVNITDVNEKEETIDFEGAIYLEWIDPRLAYDPADYGMPADWQSGDYSLAPRKVYQGAYAFAELYEGWWLSIVIPNGIGNRISTEQVFGIWPDGRVLYPRHVLFQSRDADGPAAVSFRSPVAGGFYPPVSVRDE